MQVFESLSKKLDPKAQEEREKEVYERVKSQYAKAQQRLAELVRLERFSFVSKTNRCRSPTIQLCLSRSHPSGSSELQIQDEDSSTDSSALYLAQIVTSHTPFKKLLDLSERAPTSLGDSVSIVNFPS
jgi:hypothetical protein